MVDDVESVLASEIKRAKREFLKLRNCPRVLTEDIAEFELNMVLNHVPPNRRGVLPFGTVTGSGFSCTSATKQNKHRSKNLGCVRKGVEATGI